MIFRISFPDILRFTLRARRGPLIPEGFILETPPENKSTPHTTSPTTSLTPTSPFASPVSETPSGSIIRTGNDSTETLVNLIVQPVHVKPILILNSSAHEVKQMRRISFADSAVAPGPSSPVNTLGMGQVLCKLPVTVEATVSQGEDPKESVPRVEKKPRRKNITRTMSLLAPRAYRSNAQRVSALLSLP